MPPHAHSRSFSNDYSAGAVPPEARRPRRGTLSSRSAWTSAAREPPVAMATTGNGPVTMATTRNGSVDVQTAHHDAESQSPRIPGVKDRSGGGPVTWASLPRKDQLAILFLARLVDFLQVASLQAYVFYQLKDFDPEASDARISQQAGLLQGCFTGAQVATALLWGKAADARWCGRKRVLVVGLAGTAVSCLGYGFATTFFWAAFWRAFGGAVNGTVGIMQVHPLCRRVRAGAAG